MDISPMRYALHLYDWLKQIISKVKKQKENEWNTPTLDKFSA